VVTKTAFGLGLFGALFAALVSGCAHTGGQTGEEQTPCWSKQTPLSLAEVSPLGFSAQDSLSFAAGAHSATLHWLPATDLPYGPESGDGTVNVTITSLGNARFAETSDNQPMTELLCMPSVLSDVAVDFETAGGAFHEHFSGVLVASDPANAALSASILGDHVAGNFAFDPVALGSARVVRIELNLSFGAQSFGGSVAAGIEPHDAASGGSTHSLRIVPLACWGSGAPPFVAGCAQ
jgi:hypothetical protein